MATSAKDRKRDIVLILGDSIIQKCKYVKMAKIRSFRGDTIEDMNNHFKNGEILELSTAKIIVLHVGTNDVWKLTVDEMLEDVQALINTIHDLTSDDQQICVSAIIPRPRDFWSTMPKIMEFNDAIEDKDAQWGFKYIPTYTIFQRKRWPKEEMYRVEDNLHPSKVGAKILSEYFTKQTSILRKHRGLKKYKKRYTRTEVTKKPDAGYGYPGERTRGEDLMPLVDTQPTYAPRKESFAEVQAMKKAKTGGAGTEISGKKRRRQRRRRGNKRRGANKQNANEMGHKRQKIDEVYEDVRKVVDYFDDVEQSQ